MVFCMVEHPAWQRLSTKIIDRTSPLWPSRTWVRKVLTQIGMVHSKNHGWLGASSHLVSSLVHPRCEWNNSNPKSWLTPAYPTKKTIPFSPWYSTPQFYGSSYMCKSTTIHDGFWGKLTQKRIPNLLGDLRWKFPPNKINSVTIMLSLWK